MALLWRNQMEASGAQRSLSVAVVDAAGRSTRAGAEVLIYAAGTRRLLGMRLVDTGSGYNAQSDIPVHFGLATNAAVDVEVTFPARGKRAAVITRNVKPADHHGKSLVVRTAP